MERIWKNIDERYAVSNYGEVKRLDSVSRCGYHLKEKQLKPQDIAGYLAVYIPDKETGKQKWEYVHRLVATAFIPNPDNLPYINHKDCNPKNNSVDNLEWCTPAYNTQYSLCKMGKYDDYFLTLSEEDKKQYQAERKKKYAIEQQQKKKQQQRKPPKMNHTIYVYEPVVITSYKLVAQYNTISEAAAGLKVTDKTVADRVSRYNNCTRLVKKNGKKYLVTRNILK